MEEEFNVSAIENKIKTKHGLNIDWTIGIASQWGKSTILNSSIFYF
jgi:hypothetical protein